jgi:hypothetical protein
MLQRAGLISYRRGHITVIDRAGLETRSCECYNVVKKEFHRLLNGEGSTKIIPSIHKTDSYWERQ